MSLPGLISEDDGTGSVELDQGQLRQAASRGEPAAPPAPGRPRDDIDTQGTSQASSNAKKPASLTLPGEASRRGTGEAGEPDGSGQERSSSKLSGTRGRSGSKLSVGSLDSLDRRDSKQSQSSFVSSLSRQNSAARHLSKAASTVFEKVNEKVDPFTFTVMSGGSCLACCAGMVNIISFHALNAFVSHVTGTWTHTARHFEANAMEEARHSFLLVMSFITGATVCGCLIARETVTRGYTLYGLVLLGNGALLVLVAIFWKSPVAPYLCASACGLQNGMITSYSGAVIRTTHVTGIATDIGLICGRSCVAFAKKRLRPFDDHDINPMQESKKLGLLILLGLSFAGGVVLGSLLYREHGIDALYVPAGVTIGLGLVYTIYRTLIKPRRKSIQEYVQNNVGHRLSSVSPKMAEFAGKAFEASESPRAPEVKVMEIKEDADVPESPSGFFARQKSSDELIEVLDMLDDQIVNLIRRPDPSCSHLIADARAATTRLRTVVKQINEAKAKSKRKKRSKDGPSHSDTASAPADATTTAASPREEPDVEAAEEKPGGADWPNRVESTGNLIT